MKILVHAATLLRLVLAGLIAAMAAAISGHAMIVVVNPAVGIAFLLIILPTWYAPLLIFAPTGLCLIVAGVLLRGASWRCPVLSLVGAASGAATAFALSNVLMGPSTPGIVLPWLIVIGSVAGIVGGSVFAYLIPNPILDSEAAT